MYQYIMSYYEAGKKPDLKALNSLYDYYWDCDNWDLKTIKMVRNGFKLGTAAEWIYWKNDKPRIISLTLATLSSILTLVTPASSLRIQTTSIPAVATSRR